MLYTKSIYECVYTHTHTYTHIHKCYLCICEGRKNMERCDKMTQEFISNRGWQTKAFRTNHPTACFTNELPWSTALWITDFLLLLCTTEAELSGRDNGLQGLQRLLSGPFQKVC